METLSGPCCEPFDETARVSGGNHDLVGREHRQRVRDRQQWIGVADAALRVNTPSFEVLDEGGDPVLGSAASGVFVRHPVPKPRVQRRCDHEDLGVRHLAWNSIEGEDEHVHLDSFRVVDLSSPETPLGRAYSRALDLLRE
jgi:hypothetical protein